ncbi:MAG: hypothetical protein DME22_21560 [Verrucomicrobia bacterium]|nr:MAG: hypothetical protein DME22_21560 [Verrucomicrobiota bacterium]PYK02182.1 MAG: hypothetical protein DME23_02340 [Verrucomicrobiota bacterium]
MTAQIAQPQLDPRFQKRYTEINFAKLMPPNSIMIEVSPEYFITDFPARPAIQSAAFRAAPAWKSKSSRAA